jgi:hypothetical protein
MTLADGQRICQTVNLERNSQPMPGDDSAGPLTRMARCHSLESIDGPQATATAVRYQLISRHTNYLVVDARADDKKGEDLPGLRKVPQMLAAGWGGTGSLVQESSLQCDDVFFMRKRHIPQVLYSIAPSHEDEHRQLQPTTPVFSGLSRCPAPVAGWNRIQPQHQESDKKARKTLRPDRRLIDLMANAFVHTTKDDWGPDYPLEDDQVNLDEAQR